MVRIEQLLNSTEEEVRVWVRDRKSKKCAGAGELVDNYELARRLGRWTLTGRVGRRKDEANHLLGVFHVDKYQIGHFSAGKNRQMEK